MGISLTKKELATLAGYSYRRLHDIDMKLPQADRLFVEGEGGKYDAAIFVQRWVSYNVDSEAGGDQSLDDVKAIHEKVKTRKTELEVQRMEGQLVDINEVRRIWGDVANVVKKNLLQMPGRLAPMVVAMTSVERINGIIEREMHDVLTQIAETPLPESAAREDAGDEEGEEEV
jgi:phage terminase Nu1 subunit (DNA packaging protein)